MSDKLDWAFWEDQLDFKDIVDQGYDLGLQAKLDVAPTVLPHGDYPPCSSTITLQACNSKLTTQTCHDMSDAPHNFQDRSKWQDSIPFLRQIYELRNAFALNERPTPYEISQIASEAGLQDMEVSIWFQTERDLHTEWCKLGPNATGNLNPSTQHASERPTFLERIHALRESFRENPMCVKPQLLHISTAFNIQEFEVSLWFASERCIQLDLMISYDSFKQDPAFTCSSTTSAHFQSNFDGMDYKFEENKPPLFENFEQDAVNALSSVRNSPSLASVLGKREISTRPDSNHTNEIQPTRRKRKCTNQGIFHCLFTGCDYKTAGLSSWRDHQSRKHFPRQVWFCWMRKLDGSLCQHGPVHRADNFISHLIKEHNQVRGNSLLELVHSKSQRITNLFHDRCGFCKALLTSWDESMKHIGSHLCFGINPSEWDHCCSSSHLLQEYIKKETIELPQPISAIPWNSTSKVASDLTSYPFYACFDTIVPDETKEVTQALYIDTIPPFQSPTTIFTTSFIDYRPAKPANFISNKDLSPTEFSIDSMTSVFSIQGNNSGAFGHRRIFSEDKRRTAQVRRLRACMSCRVRKVKCSPDHIKDSCEPCSRLKMQIFTLENFTEESWLKSLLNDEIGSTWRRSGNRQPVRRKCASLLARLLTSPYSPHQPFSRWHRLSKVLIQSILQFALIRTSQGLGIKIDPYPAIYSLFPSQEFLIKEKNIIFQGKEFRIASITAQAVTVIPVNV